MSALWSQEATLRTWLDIEVLACEGWAKLGKIPEKDLKNIQERANFNLEEILETEKKTKHDMAAFVSNVQKYIGESGRFLHLGMTSSDVLDTAFSYRLVKSIELILKEIEGCLEITKVRALQDKKTILIGRTHGIHAEPTTMGAKWLLWHDLLKRAKHRIEQAKDEVAVGKISGAVGNYAQIPPEVEKYVCTRLGLKVDSLSTQVIARDRYASYFSALALLGSAIETIATEIRHLQRTEVGEVREGFSRGQKGSSAMPHKRNPIQSENLTGLARLLRGMVIPALENCALWHERDISHSSVERVIGADGNILADFMVSRLREVLANLEVFPQRMQENLEQLQGVVYSQTLLIALVERGLSRDEAYEIIQDNALKALDEKRPFKAFLSSDSRFTKVISEKELDVLMDANSYLKHNDYLFQKVLEQKKD